MMGPWLIQFVLVQKAHRSDANFAAVLTNLNTCRSRVHVTFVIMPGLHLITCTDHVPSSMYVCLCLQLTPEEAEFMKRREAARQRVAQRTAQNFGFI
jgi:hypothetical protein